MLTTAHKAVTTALQCSLRENGKNSDDGGLGQSIPMHKGIIYIQLPRVQLRFKKVQLVMVEVDLCGFVPSHFKFHHKRVPADTQPPSVSVYYPH